MVTICPQEEHDFDLHLDHFLPRMIVCDQGLDFDVETKPRDAAYHTPSSLAVTPFLMSLHTDHAS